MRVVLTRRWLDGAVPLVAFLLCVAPMPVGAHTILLRSDPATGAVVRSAPTLVHLWFSTAVDPVFSTAIVENAAHTYVNDHDAQLVPGNPREMEIHLQPYLPPGMYAVAWRAVSDGDGRVLFGYLLFAIAQPDGSLQGQPAPDALHLSQTPSEQFDAFTLFFFILRTLVALGSAIWIGVSLWLLFLRRPGRAGGTEPDSADRQELHRFARRVAFARKKHLRRFRRVLGWGSLVGVGVVICLGLAQGAVESRAVTSASPPPALRHQQSYAGLLSAFHASLQTTDKQYQFVLDANMDASGLTTFTLSVRDAITGKPISGENVLLLTTMLDMPMGTATVPMHADGKARFSCRSDLISMGGLWQIGIQFYTPDHRLHKAAVNMLTPY